MSGSSNSPPVSCSLSAPASPGSRWPVPPTTLARGQPGYPALLAMCSGAPNTLYCAGDPDVLASPSVAIVGARNASADGFRAAYTLAQDLARAGFTVVSGLARGIDTAAHQGALEAGGHTVAVMATGLDRIYPRSNTKLAHAIVDAGAVVTEFTGGVEPERWHFPRRNRTISGLALATVVVEAGRPSGSLLTATAASEQGRDVFAYPWSVYHKAGEGCRWLLGQGALMACCAEDVVEVLGHGLRGLLELQTSDGRTSSKRIKLEAAVPDQAPEPVQDPILALIGDGELDVTQLSALTSTPPGELLLQLGQLELQGLILSTPLGYRRG